MTDPERPVITTKRPKLQRLDRHDAYLWLHLGLWIVGLGLFLKPPVPGSVIQFMPTDTQHKLGLCMMVGSTACLFGASMGSRFLLPKTGEDIRLPYAIGGGGLLSVGVSLGYYTFEIFQFSTPVGSLGAGLGFAVVGMCLTLSVRFFTRARRYSQTRNELLDIL